MRRFLATSLSILVAAVTVSVAWGSVAATAATTYCLCSDDISVIQPDTYQKIQTEKTLGNSSCVSLPAPGMSCTPNGLASGHTYTSCQEYQTLEVCRKDQAKWVADYKGRLLDASQPGIKTSKSKFIPDCALQDKLTDECRDVGIFVILAIRITNYLFTIVGGLALLMFVYGGFVLIISQGSSEQIDKGKNAMVAAVLGLVVAFGGYLLIQFLGAGLGVDPTLLPK